jgi:RNA 2',3'-cyclic 3'-phosphodiesterase
VAGDGRLRLFCALRLPEATVMGLVRWQHEALRDGRIVPPGNLHLTLAFLGSRPAAEVPAIAAALHAAAAAAEPPALRASGYRETRSVGMLTLDDDGGRAAAFADDVHGKLEELGVYRRDARPWLPHVTVLRFRTPPRLRPTLPALGEVVPSDAAVYLSRLSPSGAQYEVLESVALGGG